MLKKRGKIARGAIMMASAVGSVGGFVKELWTRSNNRWLVPLVIFFSLTALLLILAASVEALAPFIYAIF
jgi:hypothetical protein